MTLSRLMNLMLSIAKWGGGQLFYDFFAKIAQLAVPTFFALSGYLFFRNCTSWDVLKTKLRKRVKSLVIPFIFWSLFFYGLYSVLNHVPGIGNRINFELPSFSLQAFIIDNAVNPPMWFLKTLIVLHFTACVGFELFNRFKQFNLIWIVILAVLDLIVGFAYRSPLHWGFVYYMGAYMAYFHKSEIEDGIWASKIKLSTKVTIILLLLIAGNFYPWIFAPLLVGIFMDMIPDVKVLPIMQTSFFVMCTHYFGVRVVRKILTLLLGVNEITLMVNFFTTTIVVFLLSSFLGMFMKRFTPKFYRIVCGGR